LSSIKGKMLKMDLDLGAFGISRFAFDHWLATIAMSEGVQIHEKERVDSINFTNDGFSVWSDTNRYEARIVIGSYGKRDRMDKTLNRPFIQKNSPYVGVKYHIRTDEVPADVIALHNFKGGYCGVSRIEDDQYNLCYLTKRRHVRECGSIETMENEILRENPFLNSLYKNADFLFDKPEVINEISFAAKNPVEQHILMSGDTAGMITPLCGNGMAMAIHSARMLSEHIKDYFESHQNREHLERSYEKSWNQTFSRRHWAGRKIQSLFGSRQASGFAVGLGKAFPLVGHYLMKQTHGKPF